jgi:hypothetical protein
MCAYFKRKNHAVPTICCYDRKHDIGASAAAVEKTPIGSALLDGKTLVSDRAYRPIGADAVAMSVDLPSCRHACASGTSAIENFCRSLPPDPKMRAACWAVTLGGVSLCNSFCYAWFLLE